MTSQLIPSGFLTIFMFDAPFPLVFGDPQASLMFHWSQAAQATELAAIVPLILRGQGWGCQVPAVDVLGGK